MNSPGPKEVRPEPVGKELRATLAGKERAFEHLARAVQEREPTASEVTTAPVEDRGPQVSVRALSLDAIKLRIHTREGVLNNLDGFLSIVDKHSRQTHHQAPRSPVEVLERLDRDDFRRSVVATLDSFHYLMRDPSHPVGSRPSKILL